MVVLGKFAQYDLRFIPQIVHHSLVGVFSCLAESLLLRLVPQPIRERLLLVRSLLGAVDDVSQHIRRGNVRREKRLAVFLGKLHIPHIRRRVSPVIGKRDPCRPCPLAQLPRLVFAEIAPHILRYIELSALQIASDALVGLIDPRAVFRGGHNAPGLQQLVDKRIQRVASDLALRHHLSDVPVEHPLHVRAVRPVRAEQLHNVALRASYRPAPVLSVAQLREPSLRRLHPLHLVDIRESLIVPLRCLLVLLHPSLILAPELRGCAVVDPWYLHTRFAGRFFLTIPLRLAYSSHIEVSECGRGSGQRGCVLSRIVGNLFDICDIIEHSSVFGVRDIYQSLKHLTVNNENRFVVVEPERRLGMVLLVRRPVVVCAVFQQIVKLGRGAHLRVVLFRVRRKRI